MLPVGTTVCVVDPLHFYNGRVGQVTHGTTDLNTGTTTYLVEIPTGTGNGTVLAAVDDSRLYEVEIHNA